MDYYQESVGWLADWLEYFKPNLTPLDVLETERQYPGLLRALSVELWQRELIKRQVKEETGDSENG